MKRQGVITALEREHGKPLAEIVRPYAEAGYSRRMASEELGVAYQTLFHACRRECPEIEWPGRNSAASKKFDVPYGAITAMQRGDVEKVA